MRRIAAVVAVACIAMLCASRARGQMFIGGTSGYPPCAQITAQVAPVCADASEGYELYVWNGSAYTAAPTNISSLKVTGPVSLTGDSNNGSDQISRVNVNGRVAVTAYGASGAGINVTTGSVAASSDALSVGSAAGWSAGMGIIVPHAGAAETMTTPAAPTVTQFVTAGTTTYDYVCVQMDGKHGYTAPSAAGSISTGNATLSATTPMQVVCPAPPSGDFNLIYQTAPSNYLVAITTDTSTFDTGQHAFSEDAYLAKAFWDIPSTAPSAAAADWLQTTVSSISGTTVTLATSATTAASAVGITHDDTTPIINSFAVNNGTVYFPAGSYFFCGTPINTSNVNVQGARHGQSVLYTCPDQYTIDTNQFMYGVRIQRMTFVGGIGAYLQTYYGALTDGQFTDNVSDNVFLDYTGTAVGTENSDSPFWFINHNSFQGLDFNTTIGVLMNTSAGNQVTNNNFGINRIGLKGVSAATGLYVSGNTFVNFNQPYDSIANAAKPRAQVWVTPGVTTEGGVAFVAAHNKFGNEGVAYDDFHILYADDDTSSGTDEASYMPLLKSITDAGTTAGSATLISAQCQFSSGDVGDPITVEYAGRAVGSPSDTLTTTISSYTSCNQVTLAASASETVVGAVAHWAPADTTHFIFGHVIVNNTFWGVGGDLNYASGAASSPPVIYSTTPNVSNLRVADNSFQGAAPINVLEIAPAIGTTSPALSNVIGPNFDRVMWVENQFGAASSLIDPNGNSSGGVSVPESWVGGLRDTGFVSLANQAINSGSISFSGGATLAGQIIDAFGKPASADDAVQVELNPGGALDYDLPTLPGTGIPMWIEFDAKQGDTSPSARRLQAALTDYHGANLYAFWTGPTIMLTPAWRTYRFKVPVPNVTGATRWDLLLQNTFGDQAAGAKYADIGRIRVYQAYEPIPATDVHFYGAVHLACSGTVTLSSGTGTASNACIEASRATVCTDNTDTTATACTAVPSAGSVTIYGNGTDTVSWAQF